MENTDREYLGVGLHTALRKLCDSHPTSVMCNLFDLVPDNIYGAYLDYVWEEIKDKNKASEISDEIIEASLTFSKSMDANQRKSLGDNTLQWMSAISCTFKLFSDEDWEGYTYYIMEKYLDEN